jgi:succinate dehydrogenase hydrophobic anchor subunit
MKTPTTFSELVKFVIDFINILIPAIFGLVFLYVVWKIIDAWVIHAGDDTNLEEGKRMVTTAVIVFVIMVSTWGLVALVKSTLFG